MSRANILFNGIDPETGEASLPPLNRRQLARQVGDRLKPRRRGDSPRLVRAQPMPGVDPTDLANSGWGLVFAQQSSSGPEVEEITRALVELLARRRDQAGPLYREYRDAQGIGTGETAHHWLARQGVGPGPVDPEIMPYYLLLVGDPTAIPLAFQFELSLQFAVGRLAFPRVEDYRQYARNVIESEDLAPHPRPRATFFGVHNQDDDPTRFAFEKLITPLHRAFDKIHPEDHPQKARRSSRKMSKNWTFEAIFGQRANKAGLARLLNEDRPTLLFTTSHGLGPSRDPRASFDRVGALLCQDWPGPVAWRQKRERRLPPEFYFSAADVNEEADLRGLITFFFACYSAGLPRLDSFAHESDDEPRVLAPEPRLAELPLRLLCKRQGALAVIGHIDRARGFSFIWPGAGSQTKTFEAVLHRLMEGFPVGAAATYLGDRWALIATLISQQLDQIRDPEQIDPIDLADMWIASIDARSYLVLGDPAARLPV